MRRWLLPSLFVLALVACSGDQNVAQFWRPISEPNLLMPLEKGQRKLDFDLSQCRCGIYPNTLTHSDMIEFQADKQRLEQTAVVGKEDIKGDCTERPSLVVSECMRGRGWEQTNCSGRMPLAGGGSVCAGYVNP